MSQINSSASMFDPASPVRQAKPRARTPESTGFALPKPEFRSPREEEISSARRQVVRQDIRNERQPDAARDVRQEALARRDARDALRETVRDAVRDTRGNNGLGRRERADETQANDQASKARDPWAERAADATAAQDVAPEANPPVEQTSSEVPSVQAAAEALKAEEGSVEDTQSQIEAAIIETVQLVEPVVAKLSPEASLSQTALVEVAEVAVATGASEIAAPTGSTEIAPGLADAPSMAGTAVAGAALVTQPGTPQAGTSVVTGNGDGAANSSTMIEAKEAHGAAMLAKASNEELKSVESKPVDAKPVEAKALQSFSEVLTQANQAATPTSRTDVQTAQANLALAQGADAGAAQAAAEQRPAPEVTRPTPMHALPLEIGLQAMAGSKRFDIRLDPAELGRVDVRLEFNEDGTVTASLTADRVETLQMLQRDARTLERAFEQAGLKSSDGGIDFQLRDQGQGERQAQREQDQPSSHGRQRRGADEAMSEMKSVEAAVLRRLVPPGGVDLVI
ncbi:MAG: flagellar hook-length control protein FliK [Bosea sp. (in: a-proteobacteria)]